MLRAGASDLLAEAARSSDAGAPVDVLIIARLTDIHALSVARRIEDCGRRVLILDVADYPRKWQLTTHYVRGNVAFSAISHGLKIDLSHLRGVWYRRFYGPGDTPAISDEAVRNFVAEECRDYLHGFLATSANVTNPPTNGRPTASLINSLRA